MIKKINSAFIKIITVVRNVLLSSTFYHEQLGYG